MKGQNMKRISTYTLMLIVTSMFIASCSSSADDDGETKADTKSVEIITTILTKANPKTEFTTSDQMSVYAKSYNKLDAPVLKENVVASYNGSTWTIEPNIDLKEDQTAFIFTFSPVIPFTRDLSAIPVDVTKQEDVLYSGSAVPVSYTSNRAKITMKHALTLTSYNIIKQDYSGKGNLQKIELEGKNVFTNATMSADKGKFTGTHNGCVSANVSKDITTDGWISELPNLWVIPFSTQSEPAKLHAVIDGKEYITALPAIDMKAGFQYVFHLVLTNYGIECIPSLTETISLNEDANAIADLDNYGILKIKHHATELNAHILSGEDVFGTIIWGNGQSNTYEDRMTMQYTPGNYEVVIESWNSTGFDLQSITGIDEIDLSEY